MEQLIGFETAKLANEAGFDWETKYTYKLLENFPVLEYMSYESYKNQHSWMFSAVPVYTLQRWLREVKDYHIKVEPDRQNYTGGLAYYATIGESTEIREDGRHFTGYKFEWSMEGRRDVIDQAYCSKTYEGAVEYAMCNILRRILGKNTFRSNDESKRVSTISNERGFYIGYLTSLESSAIVWSDHIEDIKSEWAFGRAIFRSSGLDKNKLSELFPDKPERGTILEYLKKNHEMVYREGNLIGELNN